MKGFFGLRILRGELERKDQPLFNLSDQEYGCPLFRKSMCRKKFKSLQCHICFDDKNSRSLRRQTDKFAAIRDLCNSVINNYQKSFFNFSVTIDEKPFPCRSK